MNDVFIKQNYFIFIIEFTFINLILLKLKILDYCIFLVLLGHELAGVVSAAVVSSWTWADTTLESSFAVVVFALIMAGFSIRPPLHRGYNWTASISSWAITLAFHYSAESGQLDQKVDKGEECRCQCKDHYDRTALHCDFHNMKIIYIYFIYDKICFNNIIFFFRYFSFLIL